MKKRKTNLKKVNLSLFQKLKFKTFDPLELVEQFCCTVGPQRVGKTSFNRAIMNILYKKHNKEFMQETRERINFLNMQGHKLNSNFEHCFYSNHTSSLDKKHMCHDVKFEDLVIPGVNYKGQYFPFRSFIEFQEIDTEADNRDWRNFDLSHKDFMKFYGHNGLTILCDTQDYGNCDSKMRDLFTSLIFIVARERVKHWWQIKPRYTWYFFLKNNQLAESLKEISQFVKVDVPVVQAYKFTYKGEIHNTYKSRSNEPLFMRGLIRYTFRRQHILSLGPKDIENFCERYSSNYSKDKIKKSLS